MNTTISKVYGADICRDGGSYSLAFEAEGGQWYEFFVQVKGLESNEYFEPKLYKGGVNSGELVQEYSWSSASKFLSKINYQSKRFQEIIELVANNGSFT